ncbi:MAG: macro domain-containing protein [Bacillota bacterium]
MKLKVDNLNLELVQGDIVHQTDLEAIVNAANAQLRIGGGVAGAIHRAAGPQLEKECEPLAPIQVGEAVITGAHELPNDYVIHTLGPVYGVDKPEAELLEKSYRNSLEIADKKNIESIGFPAISTGAFGYPINEAAEISLKTIGDNADELNNLNLIRFVLYSSSDFEVYKEKAEKLFD